MNRFFHFSLIELSLLLVVGSFFIDAGLFIGSNRVFFPFLLSIVAFGLMVFKYYRFEKGMFRQLTIIVLLFIVTIVSSLAGFFKFLDVSPFKGEYVGFASVKILIYFFSDIVIMLTVAKTFKIEQINRINTIVKVVSLITIIYGGVEYFNIIHRNNVIQKYLCLILDLFHAGPIVYYTDYLSLLGFEHSYGVISSLILYSFFLGAIISGQRIFRKKEIDIIFALLLLTLSFLTRSKSGYISIILVHLFLVVQVLTDKAIKKRILVYIIFFSTVAGGLVVKDVIERAQNIMLSHGSSAFTRTSYLKASKEMIIKNPILGIGLGNYKFAFPEAVELANIKKIFEIPGLLDTNKPQFISDPGNMIVGFWVEAGILGLLLFVLFLLQLMKLLKKSYKFASEKPVKAFVLGLAYAYISILGSFTSKYLFNIYIWWVIFGLIIGVYCSLEKRIVEFGSE